MVFGEIFTGAVSLVPNPNAIATPIEYINTNLYDTLIVDKKTIDKNDIYSPFSEENIGKHLNIGKDRPGSSEILNTILKLKSMDDFPVKIDYPQGYPKNLPTLLNMSRDNHNVYILFANDSIIRSFTVTPDLGKIKNMRVNEGNITLKGLFGIEKTRQPERMMELLFKLLDKDIDNLPGVTVIENEPKLLK